MPQRTRQEETETLSTRRRRRMAEEMDRRWDWRLIGGSTATVLAIATIALFFLYPIESRSKNTRVAIDPPQNVQPQNPLPQPVIWDAALLSTVVDDVEVTLVSCRTVEIAGNVYDQFKNFGQSQVVAIKLHNKSKTQVKRFGGWYRDRRTKAEDEHGNIYQADLLPDGFKFFDYPFQTEKGCDSTAITAGRITLHPDKKYLTCLLFEKAVDAATEMRLSLPASELGGTGTLHLKIPVR